MNGFQWLAAGLKLVSLERRVRALERGHSPANDTTVRWLVTKVRYLMATFDEINAKLESILASQLAAQDKAQEIATDIADLKALVANQNVGGLSEGQTTAVADKIAEIESKAQALAFALAGTAAEHTPATPTPEPGPVDPGPTPEPEPEPTPDTPPTA